MPELVHGACLPQHLPVQGFLKQVQEMHPTAPLGGKHQLGQLYQGNLCAQKPVGQPGGKSDDDCGLESEGSPRTSPAASPTARPPASLAVSPAITPELRSVR
jgi:hypothetical protein